jgi:hypothetical protein
MRLPRARLALTIVAAGLLAGCGGPPTPGEPKTLANVCDRANDGKRVAVEGYLSLPSSFSESSGSASAPVIIRGDVQPAGDLIFVWVAYGSEANAMDKVGARYSQDDLKVRTKDGAIVGYQDKVRVSGTVTFPSRRPYSLDTPGVRLLDCGLNTPLIERV